MATVILTAKQQKQQEIAARKQKKQVVLADKTYASPSAASRAIRLLIQEIAATESHEVKEGENGYAILMAVVARHKRRAWLNSCGIHSFVCGANSTISIVRSDESVIDFSWRNAITQTYPDKIKQAMRNAILPQIQAYKTQHFRPQMKCMYAGCHTPAAVLKWDDVHVDHIIHFETLKHEFEKLVKKKDMPSTRALTYAPAKSGYQRASPIFKDNIEFATKWQKYHLEHAELRIVCKKCNLSLLRKKTVEESE